MSKPATRARSSDPPYDVIVVGAGHAGCEAALAAARMGCHVLLLSANLDTVALMPCNPSIGGPAKGNLVREIDALGGEMGRNTDRTFIQIRELNTGKGPAVRALRAQCDVHRYGLAMKRVLERQARLDLEQATVEGLLWEPLTDRGESRWRVLGVRLAHGQSFTAPAVVITTGTFLKGRIIIGDSISEGGRAGEPPATALSLDLRAHGFELGRLKTGTPPRLDARSIEFTRTDLQPGSETPLLFSFDPVPADEILETQPDSIYPHVPPRGWRWQMPCYRVATCETTHEIIRANLHRAPMFNGAIDAPGPRYCPSIEDKIVRFADKRSHTLFLEPEGFTTHEVYVQGANTSLPADVQVAMIRSIPSLRTAELIRPGYAVEYDFVRPHQLFPTLETRSADGLFLAGQINGTTGYEEAAAQGLVAGISAARKRVGRPGLQLKRSQAYIGVMIDDLIGSELTEPYRLHTSRAEYRLLLRHDSADLRLTPLGRRLGLASRDRKARVDRRRADLAAARRWLEHLRVPASAVGNARLEREGLQTLRTRMPATALLRRPGITCELIAELVDEPPPPAAAGDELVFEVKYARYIQQQSAQVAQARAMEQAAIPPDVDFSSLYGLRTEARQRLERFRPATLGQAARLEGVTAADVSVLLIQLKRLAAGAADSVPALKPDRRSVATGTAMRS